MQITTPLDGTAVEGGTNQVISVFAIAAAGVTNVQFLSNGGVIGNDATVIRVAAIIGVKVSPAA